MGLFFQTFRERGLNPTSNKWRVSGPWRVGTRIYKYKKKSWDSKI